MKPLATSALVCSFSLLLLPLKVQAGSATWKANPTDNNWNNSANWAPATVPNSLSDVATFGVSSIQTVGVNVSSFHPLATIVFNPDATAFTFNLLGAEDLILEGAGITNLSGNGQTFVANEGQSIGFHNTTTAGELTYFRLGPSKLFVPNAVFYDAATAGRASYTILGSSDGGRGGEIEFIGGSSAADGLFTNVGGTGTGSQGGLILFEDSAHGGNASVTNEGGAGEGAPGGSTVLTDTSNAENALLIAHAGLANGGGGTINFVNRATGGTARIQVLGNATLDIHSAAGAVSVGSLEGDGQVILGARNLGVGTSNLSTTFPGIIQGTGSLTKVGTGTLTLSGENTYSGGTTISAGILIAAGGTGSGAVAVNAGTLGGSGTISGETTVGTGSGSGAYLAPSIGPEKQVTLTIQNALTFNSDATYTCSLRAKKTRSRNDQIMANGVTIHSGAQFNLSGQVPGKVRAGTNFTVINNTAGTAISGTFANLADGSIVKVGSTNFQANYEGGDGNDLTLMVVP